MCLSLCLSVWPSLCMSCFMWIGHHIDVDRSATSCIFVTFSLNWPLGQFSQLSAMSMCVHLFVSLSGMSAGQGGPLPPVPAIIKRPGVAGAVLQSPFNSFINISHSMILCENLFNKPSFRNRKSYGAKTLRESLPPPTCHVSGVTCHVSHIICHVSHVTYHMYFSFFYKK